MREKSTMESLNDGNSSLCRFSLRMPFHHVDRCETGEINHFRKLSDSYI